MRYLSFLFVFLFSFSLQLQSQQLNCSARQAEIFIGTTGVPAPADEYHYSFSFTAVSPVWDGVLTPNTFTPNTINTSATYYLPHVYEPLTGASCLYTNNQPLDIYQEGVVFTRCGLDGNLPYIGSNGKYLFRIIYVPTESIIFSGYIDYRDARFPISEPGDRDIRISYDATTGVVKIGNKGSINNLSVFSPNSTKSIWEIKNSGLPWPILSKSNYNNKPKLVWPSYPEQVYSSPTYKIYRQVNSGSPVELATVSTTTLNFVDNNVIILSSGGSQIKYTIKAYYQGNLSPVSNEISYNGLVLASEDPGPGIETSKENILSSYYLAQNYPNPFNPSTNIEYFLPIATNVSLKIYDAFGQEVATLVDENKAEGFYNVEFNASDLASGIYFYQLKTNDFVETKKLILLR